MLYFVVRIKKLSRYGVFYALGGIIAVVGVLIGVSLSLDSTSSLTGAAVVNPAVVETLQSCQNVTWTEDDAIMSICTDVYHRVSCSDEPINLSCTTIPEQYSYSCFKGKQTVTKSKQDCDTTGYVINNVQLNTVDYACTLADDNGVVTAICDSVFDGNGDGVCQSGESCTRFVVDGNAAVRSEKNSYDEWIVSDESYFLERASVIS